MADVLTPCRFTEAGLCEEHLDTYGPVAPALCRDAHRVLLATVRAQQAAVEKAREALDIASKRDEVWHPPATCTCEVCLPVREALAAIAALEKGK